MDAGIDDDVSAPTLLPLRTIPPGNGSAMPSPRIASTAACAAASAAGVVAGGDHEVAAADTAARPRPSSVTRNSPSITGIRQKRWPAITLLA